MSFFTNNNSKVGNIPGLENGRLPTSFDKTFPTYYLPTSKERTINTAEWKTGDTTGPKDYGEYYSTIDAGKLHFQYVKTGYTVIFPAIIDSYSEAFAPAFASEHIYGMKDPIQKFSNTARTFSLAFKVIAYDEEHARKNLHAVSALAQFLYPIYDGDTKATICNPMLIRESPMVRVRFANLIQRTSRLSKTISGNGLLTVPTDFNFSPNLEAGMFFSEDGSYIYPKEIKVTMNFSALHEESLGWTKGTDSKTHWIGKLNSSGNVGSNSVDFPWGNDPIKADNEPDDSASTATASATGQADAASEFDGGGIT